MMRPLYVGIMLFLINYYHVPCFLLSQIHLVCFFYHDACDQNFKILEENQVKHVKSSRLYLLLIYVFMHCN